MGVVEINKKTVEKLAELLHTLWSSWTEHFFENLNIENILRWQAQMVTPYENLSDEDKEKDRELARMILKELQKLKKPVAKVIKYEKIE